MRRLPRYAFAGFGLIIISEAAMLFQIEPFWTWHTPVAWTGYILLVDGIVRASRGSSWLTDAPKEFAVLALASIPLWLIFEAYNLLIRNWHYINLPSNIAVRYASYAWAFATIWPGIFETSELIAVIRGRRAASTPRPARSALGALPQVAIAVGAAMLVWPLIQPSPYLAAPVWLGFIFLLDPLNARAGAESLMGDLRRGSRDRLVNLVWSGFMCGVLWEFWNYWARSKWVYTVPIMEHLKIFEMPLPGYLGFPAFALECFTMYVFVRHWLWRGPARPIGV